MSKKIKELENKIKQLTERVALQDKTIDFLSQHNYTDVIIEDSFLYGFGDTRPRIQYLRAGKVVSVYLADTAIAAEHKLVKNVKDLAVFEVVDEDKYVILNKRAGIVHYICPKDSVNLDKFNYLTMN